MNNAHRIIDRTYVEEKGTMNKIGKIERENKKANLRRQILAKPRISVGFFTEFIFNEVAPRALVLGKVFGKAAANSP